METSKMAETLFMNKSVSLGLLQRFFGDNGWESGIENGVADFYALEQNLDGEKLDFVISVKCDEEHYSAEDLLREIHSAVDTFKSEVGERTADTIKEMGEHANTKDIIHEAQIADIKNNVYESLDRVANAYEIERANTEQQYAQDRLQDIQHVLKDTDWEIIDCGIIDNKTVYVELEAFSNLGEDIVEDIQFDGTLLGFMSAVQDAYERFDVDDHVAMWVDQRGENGVPESISDLLDDANYIDNMYKDLDESFKLEFPAEAEEIARITIREMMEDTNKDFEESLS